MNKIYWIVVDSDGQLLETLLGGVTRKQAIEVWLVWNFHRYEDVSKWKRQNQFKLKKVEL